MENQQFTSAYIHVCKVFTAHIT